MREVYQTEGNENVVADTLESMVTEGARRTRVKPCLTGNSSRWNLDTGVCLLCPQRKLREP